MRVTDYIDFKKGTTNIVITAPHAGNKKPLDIPRRKYGKVLMDTHTSKVARYMINYYTQKPYYLISKIHRSRVDFNREIVEGAQGDPQAIHMWKTWHNILKYYLKSAGNPLYVDLHSHNDNDMFQLSYDLSKKKYLEIEDNRDHPLYEKLFGMKSVKHSLELYGYKVYSPKVGGVYFDGGYQLEIYGKQIPSIQIEMPVSVIAHQPYKVAVTIGAALFLYKSEFIDTEE